MFLCRVPGSVCLRLSDEGQTVEDGRRADGFRDLAFCILPAERERPMTKIDRLPVDFFCLERGCLGAALIEAGTTAQ